MIFLIDYDRTKGEVVHLKTFDDSNKAEAENARLEMELQLNHLGIEREVVLLSATSEVSLRRTHARYFENLSELVNAS